MLLVKSMKLAFIHIPKTGGTSITAALAPFIDNALFKSLSPVERRHGWQGPFHKGKMHGTYMETKRKIPDGYKVFSVVRNPWERLASTYWHQGARKTKKHPFISFPKFTSNPPFNTAQRNLGWPQSEWLRGPSGDIEVDTILRFENLEEEFMELTGLEIPHYNRKSREDYAAYYDVATIKIVGELFKEDIERWGYTCPYTGNPWCG